MKIEQCPYRDFCFWGEKNRCGKESGYQCPAWRATLRDNQRGKTDRSAPANVALEGRIETLKAAIRNALDLSCIWMPQEGKISCEFGDEHALLLTMKQQLEAVL